MSFMVQAVSPQAALPTLARLYGASAADFADTARQLTDAWLAQDDHAEPLGALALRSSPAHGAEVLGGALPGPAQQAAALVLLRAALDAQPRLYAYAEAHLWPAAALVAAGLREVSAYARLTGPVPRSLAGLVASVPAGVRIVPLSQVGSLDEQLAAQRYYSDRIGHTAVTPEGVQELIAVTDAGLGRLAYDAAGLPAGLCRVSLDGLAASLGSPAIRPDLRGGGLRRALLLSVCAALAAVGVTSLTLDTWGDTPGERAEDLALALQVSAFTPIYAS